MSAFRVYGISYRQIYDALYKKSTKGKNESVSEFDARMVAESVAAYGTATLLKPVSDKFDAPQFCREFIARADPDLFKDLTVRVYALTGKVTTKGKLERKWLKWEEGKKYVLVANGEPAEV